MGYILSSSTVYATAYLTKKGRSYLFNENNNRFLVDPNTNTLIDLMEITHFSLSDPDMNYKLTDGVRLESGDVPDISGRNDSCIKSASMVMEGNLISYDGDISSNNSSDPSIGISYETNTNDNTMSINLNVGSLNDPLT